MGKRMLATRATLDRLASVKRDRIGQPRKRPVGAVLADMNTRLRAFGIAVVPADSWEVLYALHPEIKRGWSTARIAATLNVDREGLSVAMATVMTEIASHDAYVRCEDMIEALKRARLGAPGADVPF